MLVCSFCLRKSHARPRVRRAPGLPCALYFQEGKRSIQTSGGSCREIGESSYPRRRVQRSSIDLEAAAYWMPRLRGGRQRWSIASLHPSCRPRAGLLRFARNDTLKPTAPAQQQPEETPMLTLHHLNDSRSQRILWLLEELGTPYEMKRYQRNAETRLAPPELERDSSARQVARHHRRRHDDRGIRRHRRLHHPPLRQGRDDAGAGKRRLRNLQ